MANTVQTIRAALEHDSDINLHAHPIEIAVDDTIRLQGEVGDIRAKRKAWRLARAAVGRDDVYDDLRIMTGESRGEEDLRQAALQALKEEPAFTEATILEGRDVPGSGAGRGCLAVEVEGSRVVLRGVLGGLKQRRLAEVLCWWVPGAADVDNRIHVEPPEPDTDLGLASAIELVLEKDPSVAGGEVAVTVQDSIAHLRGTVGTEEQKRLAELDCWYVAGVHDVDNALLVQSAP